jgi:ATP-dependent helicase HrpA
MARAGDMAEPYRDAFTRAVRTVRDVDIPADAWDGLDERLPAHLRVTFRVEDERGHALDESTDLMRLQRSLAPAAQTAVTSAVQRAAQGASRSERASTRQPSSQASPTGASAAADARPASAAVPEQTALRTWPDLPGGALPAEVTGTVGGATVRGYPSLVDENGTVALRVLADAAVREASHTAGVQRLLLTDCALGTKRITTRWSPQQSLTLAASPYRTSDALATALQAVAVRALTSGPEIVAGAVRDAAAYEAARTHVRARLEDETYRVAGLVADALGAYRDLDVALSGATSMALLAVVADLRSQTSALVGDGFLERTPLDRLAHLPRYLKAAALRLDKAQSDPNRDAALMWQVREVSEAVAEARTAHDNGRPDPEREARLDHARWMIEELRVSLFAQGLGTSEPVSDKRIRALLA